MHIAFISNMHTGIQNIYWMRADGAGEVQRLTESQNDQSFPSFSPDGKRLAYDEQSLETGSDIWTVPLDLSDPDRPKPGKPEPFLRTQANEAEPAFSPDGRWLAYRSNQEVEVRPFPGPEGKWQVSVNGGRSPIWSPNGRELFYISTENQIMVTGYTAGCGDFRVDKPHPWAEAKTAT